MIDSTPYRDRDAPLPPDLQEWCKEGDDQDIDKTSTVINEWRLAWDIASRVLKENRKHTVRTNWTNGAPDYLHGLSYPLSVMINIRLRALLNRPLVPLREFLSTALESNRGKK